MDEREMFGAALAKLSRMEESSFDKPFPDDELNALWAIWQAARRATPDREAIRDAAFEQCAQLVDRMAKQKHDRGADDALVRSIAARIRALKTAPTSDKGGA